MIDIGEFFAEDDGEVTAKVDGFGPQYSGYDPSGNGWTNGDHVPHPRKFTLGPNGIASFNVGFPNEADHYTPGCENWFRSQGQTVVGWDVAVMVMGKGTRVVEFENPYGFFNGPTAVVKVPAYKRTSGQVFEIMGPPNSIVLLLFLRQLDVHNNEGHHIPFDQPVERPPSRGEL